MLRRIYKHMPLRFSHKRSDYDIVRVEADRVFIIDLDLGNTSVTNDAEQVYLEIKEQWPNRRVIYRDSVNQWCELVWSENVSSFEFNVSFKPYKEHLPTNI